jgi:hypothetical protein
MMSMTGLTRAADIGTVFLTVLSVATAALSVGMVVVHAIVRFRRRAKEPRHPTSLLILGKEEPRVIYNFRKDSEANSAVGTVSVFGGVLERHDTPTRSLETESSNGR